MAKSKRGATTSKGNRSRAEDALSRKAVQHHDFVGDAGKDRQKSRAVEEQRILRDHGAYDIESRDRTSGATGNPVLQSDIWRAPRDHHSKQYGWFSVGR